MSLTLRDSVDVISDPENLETCVRDVFGMMLATECTRGVDEEVPLQIDSAESVMAVVGFGGILSGACVVFCDASTARAMVGKMTGMEFDAVNDIVKDGIGEICNMLAGAWKSKVPELSAHCGLSVPAVITGRDYKLHVQTPEFKLRHKYRFEEFQLEVTIICDGLQ